MSKIAFSNNFDPPPPKWVYEPVPDFSKMNHPKLEEDRYWEEQNRRWIEGHAGLTGAHYFYLQECILNDIDGNVFRPAWRDVDDLMFQWVDECMKDGQSLLIYKRREIGATSVFANLPYWFMKMYPGCRIGLTSGKGQDGVHGFFNDKVLYTYNRLNPTVFDTDAIQMNNTKQNMSLEIKLKVWDDVMGKEDVRTSLLVCKETDEKPDSPTNLSGRRLRYCYVDEGPLHKRLEDFLGSIIPVLNKGTERVGLLVIAGTVEPQLSSEQVARFEEMIERTKNLNFRTEMLPVWLGMVTKNGWSDQEAGMEWYWSQRSKFEESNDLKGLRDFRMQYPKDKDDVFDLSKGGMFEQDVADIISSQYDKLKNERNNPEVAYKLINHPTSGVEAIPDTKFRKPDEDGGHWIIEMPKQGVVYYQAIDGIGTGKREGAEKGSWIACTIYKGFDPSGDSFCPVAHYYERPNTIEDGYRQIVMQWNFYNKFGGGKEINYETNAATGDHFGTFLNKHGLYHYAYKQRDLSGKGYINTKRRGTAVNEHTRDWQIRQANIFLRQYAGNIKSKLLLNDLMKPSNVNADLRDAFFIFMVSIPQFDKPVVVKAKDNYKTILRLKTLSNGQTIYEQKKVLISTDNINEGTSADAYVEKLKSKYGRYWYQNATSDEKDVLKRMKI